MMHYKVDNGINIGIAIPKITNDNLFSLITEDYTVYKKIPPEIQGMYNIMFHAIYSCLMQVNEYESRSKAYKELSSFLTYIKENTGVIFEIKIEAGRTLSVVRKEKSKKLAKVINSLRRVA